MDERMEEEGRKRNGRDKFMTSERYSDTTDENGTWRPWDRQEYHFTGNDWGSEETSWWHLNGMQTQQMKLELEHNQAIQNLDVAYQVHLLQEKIIFWDTVSLPNILKTFSFLII